MVSNQVRNILKSHVHVVEIAIKSYELDEYQKQMFAMINWLSEQHCIAGLDWSVGEGVGKVSTTPPQDGFLKFRFRDKAKAAMFRLFWDER